MKPWMRTAAAACGIALWAACDYSVPLVENPALFREETIVLRRVGP